MTRQHWGADGDRWYVQSNGGHTLTFTGLSLTDLEQRPWHADRTPTARRARTLSPLNAGDSFGNAATAKTIAVTANGAPVIAVPGAQTVSLDRPATTISGISVSESGNTGGETFTATVTRQHWGADGDRWCATNGGHTLTFTGLSLATLNIDLATLKDTDGTAGPDTITVNASDSFGNIATTKTIAVTRRDTGQCYSF